MKKSICQKRSSSRFLYCQLAGLSLAAIIAGCASPPSGHESCPRNADFPVGASRRLENRRYETERVHGPNACQKEMEAFHDPQGRALHSVRAETCPPDCQRRARSDAPYLGQPIHGPDAHATSEVEGVHEPAAAQDPYTITGWIQPEARTRRLPGDIHFTTQEGKKVRAQDFVGRPIVLSFLYTRCDNPRMCPLTAITLAKLQTELGEEALGNQVQLLLITYDPDYDSPAVLAKFASTYGLRLDKNALMLQPDSKQKDRLFKELDVGVNYNGRSVNLHSIQLMLFDAQGRYVRTYHSVIWNNDRVRQDLKRLLDETQRADTKERF